MNSIRLKEEIGRYIQHADERFLQLVYGMIKADKSAIVGYKPDGIPITREEMIARAETSGKAV